MKTIIKILLILLLVIIIGVAIFFLNKSLTGNIIKIIKENNKTNDKYMYTKALCNESNYCQDNEITCQGNKTISVTPITGAVVQHPKDWQDPRSETDKNKLC
jgi:uncharacterized membrane protein